MMRQVSSRTGALETQPREALPHPLTGPEYAASIQAKPSAKPGFVIFAII